MEVAAKPGQLLNVADLIGSIPISGGTYTFPRESGGEGTIGTQTEGSDKAQVDFDLTMVDVNTDFIAGFCVYSKKMANNLPFLESFLPNALRRDYWIAENTAFDAVLAAGVTASSQVITSKNKVEMLINEVATLEAANFQPNAIVMQPSDFYDILKTEKSTGAGYGLPPYVSYENGQMRINGMPVYKANWVDANKYYVGDWSRVKKVVTEGLSISFSEHDEDNFRRNNISSRVEAQVGLAIERTDALIYGDFTAT
jgi:HK97 family phage major capsid protein